MNSKRLLSAFAALALLALPTMALAQSDATLTSLMPSAGTLTPTFDSGTISYTASVPNATTSMTVMPTAADALAAITVNGSSVTSGSLSGTISLNEGANVITTVVTAVDTVTIKTYTLTVNRAVSASAPVIYEPFNYAAGGLNGKGGTTEVGFAGTWSAGSTASVVDYSLSYGSLPTSGRSIGNLISFANRFGGARAVDAAALAGNGLLADDATLWFSLLMGYGRDAAGAGANMSNAELAFALANSSFNTANAQYYINNEGTQLGQGLGVNLGKPKGGGKVVAAEFRDSLFGTATAGILFGTVPTSPIILQDETRLIVGKIKWGATPADPDTIEVYMPDANMNLGPVVSTLSVVVDQSTYDTITWTYGDPMTMDEIRFGASYGSVIGVEATSAYWDLNGTTAGAGGATPDGTWDATSTYWNGVADGTYSTATWSAGQTAVFAAGADASGIYTVTVDGTKDIGGLSFEEGTVTLSGGTALRMVTSSSVNVASGLTATVETSINEDATPRQLTKTGAGTLVLSGTDAYGGGTVASAGVLLATVPAALPGYDASAKVLFGGGTLGAKVGGGGWTTTEVDTLLANATKTSGALGIDTTAGNLAQWTAFTTGNFGPALGLTKLGGNTLTLDQPNTFSGVTKVNAGTLALTDSLALQNSALDTSSAGFVTLTAGLTTPTFGGVSGASSNLATVISAGYDSVTALTLNPQSGISFTCGGVIANGAADMSLVKTGLGTQILQGVNTYSGTTTVSAGTLTVSGTAGTINASSGIILNGGRLLLDSSVNGTGNSDRIKDTGNVTLSRGGELALTGSASANLTEAVGTLEIAGNATVTVLSLTASRVATLAGSAFSRTANATALFRGSSLGQNATQMGKVTLTDPSGLSFVGATTLASAANADTTKTVRIVPYLVGGLTSGNGGAAAASTFITYDTTLGFRALSVANQITALAADYITPVTHENVKVTAATTITAADPAVNSLLLGAFALGGSGTLTVDSGAVLATGNASIANTFGGVTLGNGTWNEGVMTVNSGSTLTINSAVSVTGGGGLTKGGTGTLTLAAAPAYSGNTTVNAGTLTLNFPNANNDVSTITIAASGAKLNLNFTGTDIVTSLTLGGVSQPPGTYGSSSSPATSPDDIHFMGTGTVTVVPAVPLLITAIIISPAGIGSVDVDITFNSVKDFCYQLQYTELLPVTVDLPWIDVGGVSKALGASMTLQNIDVATGTSSQRFYRVVQVPGSCP